VYNFPDTKLIQVKIDQLDIGRNYLADVGILADGKPCNPDFVKMAEAYGVKGKRIRTSGEIKPAIQEAIRLNEPFMIEVVTDRDSQPDLFLPRSDPGPPDPLGQAGLPQTVGLDPQSGRTRLGISILL
jgi:thiamine pyrophosphate-dependent acetolactate synthase large subunit-like protein